MLDSFAQRPPPKRSTREATADLPDASKTSKTSSGEVDRESIGETLKELAELYAKGLLDAKQFELAKAKAIN